MVCPRCDGQGNVYKAEVQDLSLILYICDECDACWDDEQEIKIETFKDLSTFLESKGSSYEKSVIKKLGYDW